MFETTLGNIEDAVVQKGYLSQMVLFGEEVILYSELDILFNAVCNQDQIFVVIIPNSG